MRLHIFIFATGFRRLRDRLIGSLKSLALQIPFPDLRKSMAQLCWRAVGRCKIEYRCTIHIKHGHMHLWISCRVWGRDDAECQEDLVLHDPVSICGRAAVEEEVAAPGHFGILEGDGGRIRCTVSQVRQQDTYVCGARCQGLLNVFGSGGILEGSDDVSKAWRVVVESFVDDDACIVKVGSCQQVECVDGNFGWWHEASLDESKISARSFKGFTDHVVGPPQPLNDRWGEGIRPKMEEGIADG